MKLDVLRYSDNGNSTLGLLFVDEKFECYTLEDEHRDVKVRGETRIPSGAYQVTFRNEGGFDARYKARYGDFHKGMLWVRDVPGFEYILIHAGNHEGHTAGCLLVGDTSNDNKDTKGFVGASRAAYEDLYPKVSEALLNNESVQIRYHDLDRTFPL